MERRRPQMGQANKVVSSPLMSIDGSRPQVSGVASRLGMFAIVSVFRTGRIWWLTMRRHGTGVALGMASRNVQRYRARAGTASLVCKYTDEIGHSDKLRCRVLDVCPQYSAQPDCWIFGGAFVRVLVVAT
ncbi:hypothetical protein LIA77_07652 [Sarocladium implicatum]|nr:hypothetical protein LIA77_07652 [Sarocladium implicatum]